MLSRFQQPLLIILPPRPPFPLSLPASYTRSRTIPLALPHSPLERGTNFRCWDANPATTSNVNTTRTHTITSWTGVVSSSRTARPGARCCYICSRLVQLYRCRCVVTCVPQASVLVLFPHPFPHPRLKCLTRSFTRSALHLPRFAIHLPRSYALAPSPSHSLQTPSLLPLPPRSVLFPLAPNTLAPPPRSPHRRRTRTRTSARR